MKTSLNAVAGCCGVLLFMMGAPAAALPQQVPPGPDWVKIGEDDDNEYYMKKSEYKGSDAQKQSGIFNHAKRNVEADKRALAELGFSLTADTQQFDLFEKVAREQKEELESKLYEALFDVGLEGTVKLTEELKSVNPWNVNKKAVEMLGDKLGKNEAVRAALRRVALVSGKPEMAEAYQEFVHAVLAAKEGWKLEGEAAQDREKKDSEGRKAYNETLRLAVAALKVLGQHQPEAAEICVAIAGAEVSENLVYLVYLGGKVSELAKSNDERIMKVSELSKRLKGHVDEMNAAKKAWQKATGHRKAMPEND